MLSEKPCSSSRISSLLKCDGTFWVVDGRQRDLRARGSQLVAHEQLELAALCPFRQPPYERVSEAPPDGAPDLGGLVDATEIFRTASVRGRRIASYSVNAAPRSPPLASRSASTTASSIAWAAP
jgi:hypothetical protein